MKRFRKSISKTKPYLYILPSFVFLAIFTYYPFVNSMYLSFFKYNLSTPDKAFNGLSNYVHILHDPLFWTVVKNNIAYASGTIAVSVSLGMILAIVVHENVKRKGFYQVAIFYPNVIPMAAAAMVWVWLFTPGYGLINYSIRQLGFPDIKWLEDRQFALVALMVVGVWKRVGYYMIIFMAGLQNIPQEIYAAGALDGATGLKKNVYLTLPLLSPTTFFVVIIAIMHSFQAIDQIYLMTHGGPGNATNMFVYFIYENAFMFYDIGYASALTSVLLFLLLLLTLVAFTVSARRVHYA